EGVSKLELRGPRWQPHGSFIELHDSAFDATSRIGDVSLDADGRLSITCDNREIITGDDDGTIGVSGSAWLLRFKEHADFRFYGMGEKWLGLERSGLRTKFWNTDVAADFPPDVYINGNPDPVYASIPYLIVARGDDYVGILLHNPFDCFMATIPGRRDGSWLEPTRWTGSEFYLGSTQGEPDVYFVQGPTLRDVTKRLQRLVGVTPRPPLWSLGHHQCRWEYSGIDHMRELADGFDKHQIPNDGLWLDIDGMRGYRVFTTHPETLGDPQTQLAEIRDRGYKPVIILDPGVKREDGFEVYEDAKANNALCLNPEGESYIGAVWPGATAFPDFSTKQGRDWWSSQVERYTNATGFEGYWLDMNDPATGHVELDSMLFGSGGHASFHNQYATAMAHASHQGLQRAGRERPFLLTRSASTGIQRAAAVWGGDSASNEHHLRLTIPVALNMALSGAPFFGGDIGGFFEDCTPELLRAWYRASVLLPFFRNHSCAGTRRQEPWAFDEHTLGVCREMIRLRYKLLPYIYNLFCAHEQSGEAIVRPLFYDFPGDRRFDSCDDQFMCGPSILATPVLSPNDDERDVMLPAGWWYALHEGRWIEGGGTVRTKQSPLGTPIFVRDRAVIPMRTGVATDNRTDLANIELHCFVRQDDAATVASEYEHDDGYTAAYRDSVTSRVSLDFAKTESSIDVRTASATAGAGPTRARIIAYTPTTLRVNGKPIQSEAASVSLAANELEVTATTAFVDIAIAS
ncbi:MAG: glycoside hydrolase family 31 protein, partial [Planctomycetota bacterium]